MRRGMTWAELLVVLGLLFVFLLFVGCTGALLLIEVPVTLLFGWIFHVARVAPQIRVDWPNVIFSGVLSALFVIGAHAFLGWLWRSVRDEPWPWKRTLGLTTAILFLFIAGISVTGIAHQIAWQARGDEPYVASMGGPMRQQLHDLNNLKGLAIGMHDFHDKKSSFPAGTTIDGDGQALHGWQAQLLPFLDEVKLAVLIQEQRPWNDSRNEPAMRTRVKAFHLPAREAQVAADPRVAPPGYATTQYSANVHVLGGTTPMRLEDISDGHGHTLLAGTIREECPAWGYPRNVRDPALGLNTSPHGFAGESRSSVVVMSFADGSSRKLSKNIDPSVLKALATPRGGETVNEHDDY